MIIEIGSIDGVSGIRVCQTAVIAGQEGSGFLSGDTFEVTGTGNRVATIFEAFSSLHLRMHVPKYKTRLV